MRSPQNVRKVAAELLPQVTKEELEYFALGEYVELSAFSPRNLLRIVVNGISLSRAADSVGDSGLVMIDSGGGTSDYYLVSADSFG